jgi:ATP-dependent DNA helicase RecG
MGKREMSFRQIKTPVSQLKGVGPKITQSMEEKGIRTIEDLLYFLPLRYMDRRTIHTVADLAEGERGNIVATVIAYRSLFFRHARKKGYEVFVKDETGAISLKWFQWSPSYLKRICKKGNILFLSGQVSRFGEKLQMIHPDVVVLEDGDEVNEFRKIIPLYSPMDGVKQGILRKLIEEALSLCGEDAKSIFPESVEQRHELVPLPATFQYIHSPEEDLYKEGPRHTYIERLILEEYMLFQSALWMNRMARKKEKGIPFRPQGPFYQKFTDTLPFVLTDAQKRVIHEIESDMASAEPMNRLVQGDVGSGKTICAVIASCAAIDNGYQVAFMAPTEILAEQHYLSIHRFFKALDIPIAFLRGNMGKDRNAVLDGIHSGNIAVVVGTHAIIQKDVAFHNLGMVVIDEQHRFGVLQRRWLIEKGLTPDVLMMTATPIPRTLSMVVYGDLDVSVIDEMPKGRQAIKTKVFLEDNKAKVYEMIKSEINAGHQVFIVYPLVEESDKMDLLDATKMASYFQKSIFSQYRVGLLHGSMKAEEKEETMTRFKDRMIDILVCTTVIEVGIDVPNATMIVIEHAERFGLSQLHQLRGRVGRGVYASKCLLVTSSRRTELATKRLRIMEKTTDGFKIAEEDMLIRGVGDMLGTRQSGIPRFRVGDIIRDMDLMLRAINICGESLPKLKAADVRKIKEAILDNWGETFHAIT